MRTSRAALLAGLVIAGFSALPAGAQTAADCAAEAARIRRAETELPQLAVAPPDDRQIVCITLETNVLFARRLAAHLAHCPRSPYARQAAVWSRTESSYSAQFSNRSCKPTIRAYRG
jgi:hypothetical protein